jgi:hypothetical protein
MSETKQQADPERGTLAADRALMIIGSVMVLFFLGVGVLLAIIR